MYKIDCQNMKNHFHSNPGNIYPDSNIIISYQEDWQKELYIKRIAQFKNRPIGFKKIVFLGNSLIEGGGDWNKRFGVDNIVNRGISGDITEGVLSRLDEIIYYKPTAIFLLIGINDIFDNHPNRKNKISSHVAENIIQIAENIYAKSKNTKIFIQTILPVDIQKHMDYNNRSLTGYNSKIVNQIKSINRLIKEQNNFKVVDLYTAFSDERSMMNEAYTTDGVHLNNKGYETWVKCLNQFIQ